MQKVEDGITVTSTFYFQDSKSGGVTSQKSAGLFLWSFPKWGRSTFVAEY
jgi:hypothetical protein